MKIIYSTKAQEDRTYWNNTDSKMIQKIDRLIEDIKLRPFKGLGKPEPLKFEYTGYWSRRITKEHRLVYKIHNHILYILQCRYHY